MSKIQVTLDESKLRGIISKRSYKNKDGENIEVDEVKFELIELKEPKQIFEKDTMKIMKTHFACVVQTKEEREAKADTIYIGEGFTTIWNDSKASNAKNTARTAVPDDMPF